MATRHRRFRGVIPVLLVFTLALTAVQAASVVLKIRVMNPSKTERQKTEVKEYLPSPATTQDVINAGELELGYDVHNQKYFVHKLVEVGTNEIQTFEVELRDIWVIPEPELKEVQAHAASLAEALKDTDQADLAAKLRTVIDDNLKALRDRQSAFTVDQVKPIEHIRAYEANLDVLEGARKDLARLENLAILERKDPQKILGSAATAPQGDQGGDRAGTGNVVIVHIQVTNPHLTAKKSVNVREDFPAEIKATDVLDAGGLQVGYDAGRNVCYAFLDNYELGPQESHDFQIKLRNPWGGNVARALVLQARTTNLLAVARETEAYKSIQDAAQGVIKDLTAIRGEPQPEVLNVAFYRQQAEHLNKLEGQVLRLEELFQSHEKPFKFEHPRLTVKPPSPKTTWIIIYIILGFLLIVSLLFFLRWYGRTKSEQLNRISPEGTAEATRRPAGGAASGAGQQKQA